MWEEEGLLHGVGVHTPCPQPQKVQVLGPKASGMVDDVRAPLDPTLAGSFLGDKGPGRGQLPVSPSLPLRPYWKLSVLVSVLTPRGQREEWAVKVPSATVCWGYADTKRCSEHTAHVCPMSSFPRCEGSMTRFLSLGTLDIWEDSPC